MKMLLTVLIFIRPYIYVIGTSVYREREPDFVLSFYSVHPDSVTIPGISSYFIIYISCSYCVSNVNS
jgi:uncharacterized membrane protein (DUF106 family)